MYNIRVKIDGIENSRRSAGLLHIVLGFFLILKGAACYRLLNYSTILPALPVFIVAFISLLYGFFRRRIDLFAKHNLKLRLLQVVTFFTLGFIFLSIGRPIDYIGSFLFAFLCLTLLFTERRIFEETIIELTTSGISIPGNYKSTLLKWEDLSDVVIREDFLTIFQIKKKYLQYQVIQDLSIIELTKMNAFCKEQIENQKSMGSAK